METGKRLDVRLESFLRRNLSREDYDRLYTSEACVVVCPEEKKVHRYAILGHNRLYTLEIPPKKLRTVLSLEEITSIQLLHDMPKFLSGEEQLNTLHIQVDYRRLAPGSRGIGKTSSTSSNQQLSPTSGKSTQIANVPVGGVSPTPRPSKPAGLIAAGENASVKGILTTNPKSVRGKSPARAKRALDKKRRSLPASGEEEELVSTKVLSERLVREGNEEEEGTDEDAEMSGRALLFPGVVGGGAGHMSSLPDLSATPTSSISKLVNAFCGMTKEITNKIAYC